MAAPETPPEPNDKPEMNRIMPIPDTEGKAESSAPPKQQFTSPDSSVAKVSASYRDDPAKTPPSVAAAYASRNVTKTP